MTMQEISDHITIKRKYTGYYELYSNHIDTGISIVSDVSRKWFIEYNGNNQELRNLISDYNIFETKAEAVHYAKIYVQDFI